MDTVIEKLGSLLSEVVKPNQFAWILALLSGVLLFDFLEVNRRFGIGEQVEQYTFWLFILFFISVGLCMLQTFGFLQKTVVNVWGRFSRRYQVKQIDISVEEQVLLNAVLAAEPDYFQLNSTHPVVRRLRRLKLLFEIPFVATAGDFDDYKVSELGKAVLNSTDEERLGALNRDEIIRFVEKVSGLKYHHDRTISPFSLGNDE